MCDENDWNMSEIISELREFHGTGFMIGGSVTPVITVTCRNCGNTILINALISGILEKEKSQEKKEEEEQEISHRDMEGEDHE